MRPGVGGNRRAGLLVAATVLLSLGLGVGLLINIALHWEAEAQGGCDLLPYGIHVCPSYGGYADVGLALGTLATLVGFGLLWLAWQFRPAPLRLYDTEGRFPPDPAEP